MLRMETLYHEGGIFLDADVEIIPGMNFDDYLKEPMFGARENNGFIGAAVIGSCPGNVHLKWCIDYVTSHFRGDDDKNFDSGMRPYTIMEESFAYAMAVLPTTTLYPYDHQKGTVEVTPDTITYHHFFKSWASPTVSFIVPTLNRPEGLKRCLDSIKNLNYSQDLIDIVVLDGDGTVPEKVVQGVAQSKGEYIVYAADDTEFTPDSLRWVVDCLGRGADLCAFNTQGERGVLPDRGNENEHFIIKRSFLPRLENGEIFSRNYFHIGVDNYLLAQAEKFGRYVRCDDAIVHHYHFSTGKSAMDEVYSKGWSHAEQDRAQLQKDLEKLKNTSA